MPRVLYVNHTGAISGAEHSLLTLLAHTDREAYEPHVAAPEGALLEAAAKLRVPTHPVPLTWIRRTQNPITVARQVLALRAGRRALSDLADELAPRIVHANGVGAQLYASCLHGRDMLSVVWHLRDMRELGRLGARLARRADAAIATSRAVAAFYAGLPLKGVPVIYNGVDLHRFAPREPDVAIRRKLGLPEEAVVFVCIGQAVAWKRHEDFAAAAAQMRSPHVHCLLVRTDPFGHGEPLNAPIPPSLAVVGSHGDIPRLLASCDALVLPSANEPFGRTVIEAMAVSLPVIVTDSGGPPELVEHDKTGIIIPTGNVQAMVAAMERLATDADLRLRMGMAGRRRAEELFGAMRHAQFVRVLYDHLTGYGSLALG